MNATRMFSTTTNCRRALMSIGRHHQQLLRKGPLAVGLKSSLSTTTTFESRTQQQQQQSEKQRMSSLAQAATAPQSQTIDIFPSIVISDDDTIMAQGPFAEAQAQFLDPDPIIVTQLAESLLRANMGIVAHYYMDVELQGILTALQKTDPRLASRVGIADSLKMGDMAVQMCRNHNVTSVACLGVDFMSESVQAILEQNNYGHVPVYRADARPIGCSLAESAERDSYRAWLQQSASSQEQALHVIYINTSLETKAVSSSIVPTITCTSSNVLQTMLQASAQVGPDLKILYGPDTYMGQNLVTFLDTILKHGWTDEQIASNLHAHHTRDTIATLRDNMNVFPSGNCVVHHMFGDQVVDTVRKDYDDAYVTAHLEVPGEMFRIAMEKSLVGRGITGSTSDILNFISRKVREAAANNEEEEQRLRFILGTEAGMVTSIVQSVQDILRQQQNNNNNKSSFIEAEIIFPVASQAVVATPDSPFPIVPGVAGGEGCSTSGGCATCPFMKMNDIDSLVDLVDMVEQQQKGGNGNELKLQAHLPPNRLRGKMLGNKSAIEWGTEPIMHMRQFMQNKSLPKSLIDRIKYPR